MKYHELLFFIRQNNTWCPDKMKKKIEQALLFYCLHIPACLSRSKLVWFLNISFPAEMLRTGVCWQLLWFLHCYVDDIGEVGLVGATVFKQSGEKTQTSWVSLKIIGQLFHNNMNLNLLVEGFA